MTKFGPYIRFSHGGLEEYVELETYLASPEGKAALERFQTLNGVSESQTRISELESVLKDLVALRRAVFDDGERDFWWNEAWKKAEQLVKE